MQDYPCTKDVIPRFGLKKWRSYTYSELFSFQTIQGNVENSVFQVAAMASISTSTSCGSFAAWMQVLAGFGDGINYFQRWNCRSFFLHLQSYQFIHLVHRSKVLHIFQVYIDLDYLVPWWTCSLQDVSKILDALSLWKILFRGDNDQEPYVRTVCSLMPPSTIFPVLSAGTWPLRKIRPGTLVAWARMLGQHC